MFERFQERRLLLIESHPRLRADLSRALSQLGFTIEAFATATEALERDAARHSAVQVIDLCAPGAAEWLRSAGSADDTIVLVSNPTSLGESQHDLLDGMELVYKPFSIHALEALVLARVGVARSSSLAPDAILETQDPHLVEILARARRLARRRLPVSIEGEIGTGRRALAEAIHAWSPRAGQSIVSIEGAELETASSASVDDLVLELMSTSVGGSVLIVDPVNLSSRHQSALVVGMRHFEEKGPRWLTITSSPLDDAVREGRLMLELQYRLDAARLRMPALRHREIDHSNLCDSILRRVGRQLGEIPPAMTREMVDILAKDGFPGNCLGLESRLRSALIRSDSDLTRMFEMLLGDTQPKRERPKQLASLHLKTLERDTIVRALAHWEGNRTRASEALGISVRTLRNKIRDYGLR